MSHPQRIFVTRKLALDPVEVVGPGVEIDVFEHDRPPTRDELLSRGRGASALVTLLSDRVDGALLDALPEVLVVANHAVGVDNVDVHAATARGVWVTHTPDVLTQATCELTWALVLAVARRLREGERMVRDGAFHGWSPTMLLGRELCGGALGVYGFGRIGQAVARVGLAFGMSILACSKEPLPASFSGLAGVEAVDKRALLERSDVLTIHCPLTPETHHAFGALELSLMKRGALLINTARGPVVDEAALVSALSSGHLGGAGLDVYEAEPMVHPGLVGRDDVVLLPHVGSATLSARRRMAELALSDAARVLRGERPAHPVQLLPESNVRRTLA